MDWPRLLSYITGTVDQELLLRMNISSLKIAFSKLSLANPYRE